MLSALGSEEWRHSNKIMNFLCSFVSKNPVSHGLFFQACFRFSSLQIIYPVGFLYLKLFWGIFVFEAQNDMTSQVKKKEKANLKAKGGCWKQ